MSDDLRGNTSDDNIIWDITIDLLEFERLPLSAQCKSIDDEIGRHVRQRQQQL